MSIKALKVLLVEDSDASAKLAMAMLAFVDPSGFEVRTAESLMGALDLLGSVTFDVILLDLSLPDSDGIGTLTTIRVHAPKIPVLVLTAHDNEAFASSAIQHGAQDYIVKGQFDGKSLSRALHYAVRRHTRASHQDAAESEKRAAIVGVIGAKGGTGTTTIATQISLDVRALTQQDVLLVDLDLCGGTVAFLTKTRHAHTVLDASLNLHRLDSSVWESFVCKHASGVDILQSPGSHRYGDQLLGERVRHVLRLAQSRYAWIVIDMGRLNEVSLELIGELDELLLVATADVVSLYEAKRMIQKLHDIGYPPKQIKVILNRASRGDVDVPELEKAFAIPINAFLPQSFREVHEAYANGKLLPENGSLRKQITKLARGLKGIEAEPEKFLGRNFLGLSRTA
jgi:Flp pilus assembly CpaE family ATPase